MLTLQGLPVLTEKQDEDFSDQRTDLCPEMRRAWQVHSGCACVCMQNLWMHVKQGCECVFVTQTPLCLWKEVHTGQDCDTNEETGHWDNSDFLTHADTHTQTHFPRCLDTPHSLSFYNSPSIFLQGQMSFSAVTGRQRADRVWPASQTPAWKHRH